MSNCSIQAKSNSAIVDDLICPDGEIGTNYVSVVYQCISDGKNFYSYTRSVHSLNYFYAHSVSNMFEISWNTHSVLPTQSSKVAYFFTALVVTIVDCTLLVLT